MDIIPKRIGPRCASAFGGPLPGARTASETRGALWIEQESRSVTLATGLWDGLALQDIGEALAEDEPAHRVRIDADRQVRVIDARTGRRLHMLGEIRLVGRVWRFVLATRQNGFPAALNSVMSARLAQLDGAPMGGPRTPDALAAEISSLLGYDAHR